LAATQVWVASRSGTACAILGGVLVVALFRRHARGNRKHIDVTLVVAMAGAVVGAGLVVLASVDQAADELLTIETSKLHIIGNSFSMLRDFGIWGVGRGAFEEVFPRFREGVGHLSVSHPENFLAQWTTEWGVPVAALALGAIAFALRPRVALVRARVVSGAWAALVALAVQNLVDFSSEVAGVMVTAATCAAVVVAGSSGLKPSGRLQRWSQSSRRVAIASACASALSLALGLGCLGKGLEADRDALYQALWRRTSLARMHTLARAAMRRHPTEPYLPYAVGLRAIDRKDESPFPWLGATLERARIYGAAHFMLADVLASRSPSQARLEYRLAIEQAPILTEPAAARIPDLVQSYDDALEVVPQGKGGAKLLELLIGDLRERLPATCVRLDRELSDRTSDAEGPADRAAEAAVADLEAGDAAPWCQAAGRSLCVDRALAGSRGLQKTAPHACRGYILEARARFATDDRALAVAALERAADEGTDRKACLRSIVEVAMSVHDGALVESSLHQIRQAGCGSDEECLEDYLYVAVVEKRVGNMASALIAYKRAYEHAPENDQVLEQLADAAARSGVHGEAADHYQKLAERHPEDKRWRVAADQEHDALLGDLVKR
jgi:tetratricopeptide (TPR) repeat protein